MSGWIFFPRLDATGWTNHPPQWCLLHPMHHPKFVSVSAVEAELGALFLNMREGRMFRLGLALEELGHPQPPTPIHCDNATATVVVNDTVRRQRSRMFEMRYFMAAPRGQNLGGYPSKHHEAAHHKQVRPIYLHLQKENVPVYLSLPSLHNRYLC